MNYIPRHEATPRRALYQKEVGRSADARNRAIRTFLWGLSTDILVAVVIYLLPIFGTTATDWSTLDWKVIALTVAKTIVMTIISYVARYLRIQKTTITV